MATTQYKQPSTATASLLKSDGGKQTLKGNVASAGAIRTADYDGVKTSGIKIRGTGAATKGVTARGPMA